MPILQATSANARRSEPLVWLRRIALYKSLDPVELIRPAIPLHTGVNVVWGIEGEDSDQQLQPGHGVGKTTFCRLIRYCLGESSFGQKHPVTEVRNTFAKGYVGAEVRVAGQTWSVLRPFGHHRPSFARADVSIEDLIADKPDRSSYDSFCAHLAATCLAGFRTEGVLSGGGSIGWNHLLAMCARDQEARYQDLWNWRSGRSDADSLGFRLPKVDALLCLRAVLGLLPDEETKLQTSLHHIAETLTRLDNDIAGRKREPEYWLPRLRRDLEETYGCENAIQASFDSEDLFGLPQIVKSRIQALETQRDEAASALVPLERRISEAAASLQEPTELQSQEATAAKVTDEGTETLLKSVNELVRELEELKSDIQAAEFSLCKYGDVSIGNCDYAKQHLVDLDGQIRDTRNTESAQGARRDQATAALRDRIGRRAEVIQQLRKKLDELHAERDRLRELRRTAVDDIKAIGSVWDRLQKWSRLLTGQEPDSELSKLIGKRKDVAEDETRKKAALSALLGSQNEQIVGIRQVHGDLVKATLSSEFVGRVNLSEDGLEFRVRRGESLSGEAFETLSILLADLGVLFMGALDQAKHPGFLVHDSPREADLGGVIYERLLRSVAEIAAELRGQEEVPFQYIVTTTTPPPKGLRTDDLTRLRLGGEHGLLFGCQLLTSSPDAQTTFPTDGESD